VRTVGRRAVPLIPQSPRWKGNGGREEVDGRDGPENQRDEWWVMMKMNQRISERDDWREGREMTTDGGKNRGEG
jgi:hypothetical protein